MKWPSIPQWLEDRTGLGAVVGRLMRHPVPPGAGWLYVFGSATLMAFLLQVITGAALATVYVPAAGDAYQSLEYITDQAALGRLLRGLHYFGASAMMILIAMHAVRVFLTGSYKYPREMNWLSGVLLLALTVSMAFTGQILRWDQDGVWSAVVGSEQALRVPLIGKLLARMFLAGDNINGETLSHMYAYHVFFIPGLVIAGIALHMYLVIRNGISEPPRADRPVDAVTYRAGYQELLRTSGRPFWPDAIWRDVLFGTGVLLLIAACALIVGPRALGLPPDPSLIAKDPRPDWYMLWYFALLALLPARLESWIIWLFPALAGLALIGLPFLFSTGQRHPARRPWAWGFVVCGLVAVGVLTRIGIRSPWTPDVDASPLPKSVIASGDSTIVRGAMLFHDHACESCHRVSGYGGIYGPDLTYAGDRFSQLDITLRISNGAHNMPAFGRYLSSADLDAIATFVKSRTRAHAATPDAR
jgi:ubiquinol-cytochrome c reductase cytochrome b subunit